MHQTMISFGISEIALADLNNPKFLAEIEKIKQKYGAVENKRHPNPFAIELDFDLDFESKNDGKLNPVLSNLINELYENHLKKFGELDDFYLKESYDDFVGLFIKP